MFTVTITPEMLDFMESWIQNEKVNSSQYEASVSQGEQFDAWLTALAAAVQTS